MSGTGQKNTRLNLIELVCTVRQTNIKTYE